MKDAEKAKITATLLDNNAIIKADGDEFFANLKEDEAFKYFVSDMVSGKTNVVEDDEDGGIRIEFPMEKAAEVKIEKATEEDILKEGRADVILNNTETVLSSSDVAERGASGANSFEQESFNNSELEENSSNNIDNNLNATAADFDSSINLNENSSNEKQESDDIYKEEYAEKQELDKGQTSISNEYFTENKASKEGLQESIKSEPVGYDKQTESDEVADLNEEEKPSEESDLDREIREEMERMKNEGLMQDNSKIVIDKYDEDEDSMNY